MSELTLIKLHIEDGKYAYYHVEQLNTKVILIHEPYKEDELLKLVRSLEAKEERKCPFLIIVDKDNETPFNDLSRIAELVQKGIVQQRSVELVHVQQPPKEVFKIEMLPQFEMPFIPETRSHNPHRNRKSHNCKIRRK